MLDDLLGLVEKEAHAQTQSTLFAHHVHLTWSLPNYPAAPTDLSQYGLGGLVAPYAYSPIWKALPFAQLATVDVFSATLGSSERMLVREYQLNYTYNTSQTRSFLASVQLVGDCDVMGGVSEASLSAGSAGLSACVANESLPPTTFAYSGISTSSGPVQVSHSPGSAGQPPTILATIPAYTIQPGVGSLVDLTGDGVADYFGSPGPEGPSSITVECPPFEPGPSSTQSAGAVGSGPGCSWLVEEGARPYSIVADWTAAGQNSVLDLVPPSVRTSCASGVPVFLWQLSAPCGGTVTNQALPQSDVLNLETYLGYLAGGAPDGLGVGNFIASRAFDVDGDGLPDITLLPSTFSGDTLATYNTYFTSRDRNGIAHPLGVAGAAYFPSPDIDPTVPPYSAVSSSSTAARAVTDMDGDGLGDLVLANKYDVNFKMSGPTSYVGLAVLPSRGDGRFGVPSNVSGEPWQGYGTAIIPGTDPNASPEPPTGPLSAQTMQNSTIRFGDLNNDGFADFALLDGLGLSICLRVGGWWDTAYWNCAVDHSFTMGMAESFGIPETATITIGDVDGSGINQVVYFPNGFSQKGTAIRMSPGGGSNGTPDGLLATVSNGRGGKTSFSYQSVHDLNVGNIPVPRWVVTSTTTTNGLSGSQAVSVQENYEYSGALYDARDQLFVGFKSVTKDTVGDTSGANPGTRATTTFATITNNGCSSICPVDALVRASRGLPELVEVDADPSSFIVTTPTGTRGAVAAEPTRISTTAYSYIFQSPYTGLDFREGLSVEQRSTAVYRWNQGQESQSDKVGGAVFLGASLPEVSAFLPASEAPIVSSSVFDANGNEIQTTDSGRSGVDVAILTKRTWELPLNDQSGWNYRVFVTQTGYAGPGGNFDPGQSIREWDDSYDGLGRLTEISAPLTGPVQSLPGPAGAKRSAGQPQSAVFSSPKLVLRTLGYDAFGNVIHVGNQDNACMLSIDYDALFTQLPSSETVYPGGCNTPGLVTGFVFDRRLEQVTSTLNPAFEMTVLHYDDFGRMTEFDEPSTEQTTLTTKVATADYQDVSPISRVHVSMGAGLAGSGAAPTFTDHYLYVDGLGDSRASVDAVEPATHQGQSWVIAGLHTSFADGRVASLIRPQFASGPSAAGTLPPEVSAPSGARATFSYDGLGRTVQIRDFLGNTSSVTYRDAELAVDLRDAEQLSGAHLKSLTTISRDGHGRVTSTDVHLNSGPQGTPGDLVSTATYQATGEPKTVTQVFPGGSVARQMTYDSLGRLVQNVEPNAGTWTYAYDAEGRLVGTSDARGCGENLFRDVAGRVLAADYSPCLPAPAQDPYTPATITPGLFPYPGAEESYLYGPTGLLTNIADRGRQDTYSYRGGGFLAEVDRQLALPRQSGSSPVYGNVYAKVISQYDVAGRVVQWQHLSGNLPLPDAAAGTPNRVSETTSYTPDGQVAGITATPSGTILQNQSFNPDGTVSSQTFGDVAATGTVFGYNANGALTSYTLARGDGPWVPSGVSGYSPPPAGDPTLIGNLMDVTVVPDKVGNPTTVTDASPANWPSGLKPTNVAYAYWDDYRLRSVTTKSPADTYANPYSYEQSTNSALYPQAAPPTTGTRLRSQSFQYDWRGNVTMSSDDATDFFQRSLGTVTIPGGKDQISQAVSPNGDHLVTQYDPAGNLTQVTVETAPTSTSSVGTTSTYKFGWDELGQLSSASRQDASGEVDESYVYDGDGERVQTSRSINGSEALYTLNVFDSMVLKDAPLVGGDYLDAVTTEQVYFAGGMARVFDDVQSAGAPGTMPQASTGNATIHTFLNIGDRLDSGSFVIDKDSSELVERSSYLSYGAPDIDYRSPRWESSREDLKYTGQWDNAEVGLVYLGARYYSPQLGRFVSPDPSTIHGLVGDANPYEYAYGSPLLYVDPTGLQPEGPPEADTGDDGDDNGGGTSGTGVVPTTSSGGGTGNTGSSAGGDSAEPPRGNSAQTLEAFSDYASFVAGTPESQTVLETSSDGYTPSCGICFPKSPPQSVAVLNALGNAWSAVQDAVVDPRVKADPDYFLTHSPDYYADIITPIAGGLAAEGVEGIALQKGWGSAAVNGNSLLSSNAQHVYEILRTDAADGTEVYKYGISGGPLNATQLSVRAETQVSALTRAAGGQFTYESAIVEMIPGGAGARAAALALERQLVYDYLGLTGAKPPGNIRP